MSEDLEHAPRNRCPVAILVPAVFMTIILVPAQGLGLEIQS